MSDKDEQKEDFVEWHAVSRLKNKEPEPGVAVGAAEVSVPAAEPGDVIQKPAPRFSAEEKEIGALSEGEDYSSKVIEQADFKGQMLDGQSFRGASLIGADFSGASLKNVDLSGADLSGANLSGVDLSGANLSGAILRGTNFTGACLNGIKLAEADLDGAVLLDLRIDELGLQELQDLVEYLAKYFPHKLNLAKMNLTLLDLKRIDLKNLDLRGVDFTGVDFTGVNIIGLNLSECLITPQQIAQAMGRNPTRDEMMQLLMPRKKERGKEWSGIDWESFFRGGEDYSIWDATKDKGISIEQILQTGKKVFRKEAGKPKVKDEQIVEQVKAEQKNREDERTEKIRENIEKNRQAVLEARKERQKEQEGEKSKEERRPQKELDLTLVAAGRSREM